MMKFELCRFQCICELIVIHSLLVILKSRVFFHRYPFTENVSGLPERTNEVAGSFARATVEAAKHGGVRVIDLWTTMQKNPHWKTYLR